MEDIIEGDNNFVESLISEVFVQKFLYDKGAANFRNKALKEKVWNDIGNKLGKTGEQCRKKWKSLRERFSRELKRQYDPSGSGALDKIQWEYYELLVFLKDHVAPRPSISNENFENVQEEYVEEDNSSLFVAEEVTLSSESNTTQRSSKRKHNDEFSELCSLLSKKVAELKSTSPPTAPRTINQEIMLTNALLIDELPPLAQEETRAKINEIITQMRLKYLYDK